MIPIMEILGNFGVEPILLTAQIINFLIVFFILKKFLYKPVLELLKKRKDTIAEGIRKTEDARIRLEKAASEEKIILKSAQTQAKMMIEQAKNEAIKSAKKINDDAKKQTEVMLKNARTQIERESLQTEKRLAVNVSKLAVEFLQKSLKDFFSQSEQEEIMKNAIKKIL